MHVTLWPIARMGVPHSFSQAALSRFQWNVIWQKRGFVERLCVTPGAGYLHKIKTLPCSASNNHWLLFYPWWRIGFYLCLIFACFRPSDMEQLDVWELRIHPNETSWLIWMHWMQRIHSFYYLYKNIFYEKSRRNFKNIWRKKAEAEILKRI